MNPAPVVIIGNVTADPELTITASGQSRLSFSVASNYVWYDQAGEKQEKVSFFNITAWRYTADNAAKTLEKGIGVIVTGRLEQRTWEDKETGQKRSTVEVIADEIAINTRAIEAVTRRAKQEGGQDGSASQAPRRQKPTTSRQPVGVGADESEPF
ncbi:MAG: single-stranded DNA-binding protein [Snowella sp.]|nr:single-stranded DNA-binding protein [Snowella sp.]